MIKIFEYNETNFCKNGLAFLGEARNAAITLSLDQPHTITFDYPAGDKASYITVNRIAVLDGMAFRIKTVSREQNEGVVSLHVEGVRLFFDDLTNIHIPTVPAAAGVYPYDFLSPIISAYTRYELLNTAAVEALGLIPINSAQIDFFATDKINPYDLTKAVTEAYGRGEIYIHQENGYDSFKFAIVEQIGFDNGVRLRTDKNMQNLTVERSTTDLCTRLYPYGKDDLTISAVSSTVYVDSPNISTYGIIEGYKDYSEIDDQAKLLAAAKWDLCGDNTQGLTNYLRADVPHISISGAMIDIMKIAEYGDFENVGLGDVVSVNDNSVIIKQRIVSYTYYPLSDTPAQITIGTPTIDAFYSMWQQSLKTVKKNSSGATAKIKAQSLSSNATVTASSLSVNNVTASTVNSGQKLSLTNKLFTALDNGGNVRSLIGLNGSNNFIFVIKKGDGTEIFKVDDNGATGDFSGDLTVTYNGTTYNVGQALEQLLNS